MTVERLREAHLARPFKPFQLQTADGREIEVFHPECLLFSRSGRTIAVATPADSIRVIDLLPVVAFEYTDGARRPHRRKA